MLSGGHNSEFDPVRCALDSAAYQNWLEHPRMITRIVPVF